MVHYEFLGYVNIQFFFDAISIANFITIAKVAYIVFASNWFTLDANIWIAFVSLKNTVALA